MGERNGSNQRPILRAWWNCSMRSPSDLRWLDMRANYSVKYVFFEWLYGARQMGVDSKYVGGEWHLYIETELVWKYRVYKIIESYLGTLHFNVCLWAYLLLENVIKSMLLSIQIFDIFHALQPLATWQYRVICVNTHLKSLTIWLICMDLVYHIFTPLMHLVGTQKKVRRKPNDSSQINDQKQVCSLTVRCEICRCYCKNNNIAFLYFLFNFFPNMFMSILNIICLNKNITITIIISQFEYDY